MKIDRITVMSICYKACEFAMFSHTGTLFKQWFLATASFWYNEDLPNSTPPRLIVHDIIENKTSLFNLE